MSNNRDTKFQGFAKLLADDLYDALNTIDAFDDPCAPLWMLWSSVVEPIIARRAYDLVKHTIIELRHDDDRYADDWTQKISDLTKWHEDSNDA